MKLQIVKTDKGYVAISDERIKLREWYVNTYMTEYARTPLRHLINHQKDYRFQYCKKIIATDTTFKLEGIPQFDLPDVLNGESVNLFLGYDEKSVQALVEKDLIDEREQRIAYHWFWIGLKAAQEKGCYTEEDLRKAINEVFNIVFKNSLLIKEDSKRITYDVIDSLKQPKKLVAIEVEHEMIGHPHEWIDTPISVKSEQYPDGLLTIKQYYYE